MTRSTYLWCHVWLVDSEPPIWRRFQISDRASLADLHRVLQVVMGWQNSHLHEFNVGGDRFAAASSTPRSDAQDSANRSLASFNFKPEEQFIYLYDFGDGWIHLITVESATSDDSLSLAQCLEGERACPPENSGGVWGYQELLEQLEDPEDPNFDDLLDWIGPDFDPEHFDCEQVNHQLSALE